MDTMPSTCKTCTQYLSDKLPNKSCYTYCPKYNRTPIKIENPTELKVCPQCNQTSLFWNVKDNKFECQNSECKAIFSEPELRHTLWHNEVLKYDASRDSGYMNDGGWGDYSRSPYDIEHDKPISSKKPLHYKRKREHPSFWEDLKRMILGK